MLVIKIPCLIVAAVCFGLRAFNVNVMNLELTNLGYMFVVISVIVG